MAHMSPHDVPQDNPVLDGRNGGEESMMSFVRHHILEALQPISDSLRETQQQVAHMAKDVALTDTKVDEHQSALQKVDNELMGIRNSSNALTSWMNRAQVEMRKEAEGREKVESDVDATKSAMAKANERHQHCMATVENLDRKLGHLNSHFGTLKDLVAGAEADIQGHGKHLAALQDSHEDLATHHGARAQELQQARELGEATVRDLQRLVEAHQHHCEETDVSINDIGDHLLKVRKTLDATVDLTDKDRAELKQNADFVKSIRQCLGHKDGVSYRLDGMQARDDEMYNALKKHLEAFEHLQRLVESLSGGALGTGGGDGGQPRGGGSDQLEELRVQVSAHEGSIDKIRDVQATHVEQLKDAIMALEKLQRDSRRIKDYADGTQNELAGLVTAHKQANTRMDSHTIDTGRLASDVQVMGRDVDSNLRQVKGDLGSTSAALSKLRSNFDATNTNMFGLAKGFQDAGRHVISADGGRSGTMSPALRPLSTMRTPRGPAQAIDAARQQLPFSP